MSLQHTERWTLWISFCEVALCSQSDNLKCQVLNSVLICHSNVITANSSILWSLRICIEPWTRLKLTQLSRFQKTSGFRWITRLSNTAAWRTCNRCVNEIQIDALNVGTQRGEVDIVKGIEGAILTGFNCHPINSVTFQRWRKLFIIIIPFLSDTFSKIITIRSAESEC